MCLKVLNAAQILQEQHKNPFNCGPFDVHSKTINQTAQAVSLACQKDQAHETAVAVRLVVSSVWLQTEHDPRKGAARRHLLCHPALGRLYWFPAAQLPSPSLRDRELKGETLEFENQR